MEEVEAIAFHDVIPENLSLRGFSNMKKLRLLITYSTNMFGFKRDGCPSNEYLSNELRFLDWYKFPFNSFPPSFQPHGLVELYLYGSKIKQLWNNPMKVTSYFTPISFEIYILLLDGFKFSLL